QVGCDLLSVIAVSGHLEQPGCFRHQPPSFQAISDGFDVERLPCSFSSAKIRSAPSRPLLRSNAASTLTSIAMLGRFGYADSFGELEDFLFILGCLFFCAAVGLVSCSWITSGGILPGF